MKVLYSTHFQSTCCCDGADMYGFYTPAMLEEELAKLTAKFEEELAREKAQTKPPWVIRYNEMTWDEYEAEEREKLPAKAKENLACRSTIQVWAENGQDTAARIALLLDFNRWFDQERGA